MGLFDQVSGSLKGVFGQMAAEGGPALIAAALAKTKLGGMQGLVEQLQQGGLGDQVKSWLGSDGNMPVTPDQIRSALGNEHVRALAEHFGVPVDDVAKMLAEHLPAAVDQASPNGAVQDT